MLRFLFVQAIQPYLRHMHAWAFTPHVRPPRPAAPALSVFLLGCDAS